jgi:hypothetical protein
MQKKYSMNVSVVGMVASTVVWVLVGMFPRQFYSIPGIILATTAYAVLLWSAFSFNFVVMKKANKPKEGTAHSQAVRKPSREVSPQTVP